MKKIIFAGLLVLPVIAFPQYTYDQLQVNFLENENAAKNFTYENLRLFPIKAKEVFKKNFQNMGKYVPLKDAIQARKIVISEKSGGGSVNELLIENKSSDTIIILVGEVIQGGKQDRVVNKDMLLPPKSGKKQLPVFCVESGRWSYKTKATSDNFDGYFKVASMGLRKVVEKDAKQDKVWAKVEDINKKNNTSSHTGTYTALTRSSDFNKKLDAYTKFFKERFSKEEDVIGVVVVTGNKVLGCDMFATPGLFKQNLDNLLSSYVTEAILEGNKVAIHHSTVKKYMDGLLTNEKQQESTLKEKGNSFTEKGKKLRVSSYE